MDMKDMSKASSRIYVGNLADCVDSEGLAARFRCYGVILGVKRRAKQSYAFIQFEMDASAQEAIRNENQKLFAGRPLIVNAAVAGAHAYPKKEPSMSGEDIAPLMDTPVPPLMANNYNERPPRFPARPPFRDRSPLVQPDNNWQPQQQQQQDNRFPPPPKDNYNDMQPKKNDCEIIVVSDHLTRYAEYIEERLRRVGLTVDLLYPNEDVPIGRILGNVQSRGTLYAILVMPQNEERRSLTLNMLHGLLQEHRNMPLEDAITLIARNYAEFQRCGSTAGNEAVTALLHQLANGQVLTLAQYDRILDYIKDRREKQLQNEEGTTSTNNPQANLQQRIMSILNNDNKDLSRGVGQSMMSQTLSESNKSDNVVYDNAAMLREKIASMLSNSLAAPLQVPAPQPVAAPNMKMTMSNPTIQKALDSLMH